MIYKYRLHISTLIFIGLLIFGTAIFGYIGCRDGWKSPSIGSRGACSHHGGVTSNLWLIFIVAAFSAGGFYMFVDSRYRVYNNLIVSNKLPLHPLERELESTREFKLHPTPTMEAKSRKDFDCRLCKQNFSCGTVYIYYPKGSKRVRYCKACASSLPQINAEIEKEKNEYIDEMRIKLDEIEKYYFQNAKAKLY